MPARMRARRTPRKMTRRTKRSRRSPTRSAVTWGWRRSGITASRLKAPTKTFASRWAVAFRWTTRPSRATTTSPRRRVMVVSISSSRTPPTSAGHVCGSMAGCTSSTTSSASTTSQISSTPTPRLNHPRRCSATTRRSRKTGSRSERCPASASSAPATRRIRSASST